MSEQTTLQYKGYFGSIETDINSRFSGKLLSIPDNVTYHGDNIEQLTQSFIEAVNHYQGLLDEVKKNKPLQSIKTL